MLVCRTQPTLDGSSQPPCTAGRRSAYSTATTPSDIPSGAPCYAAVVHCCGLRWPNRKPPVRLAGCLATSWAGSAPPPLPLARQCPGSAAPTPPPRGEHRLVGRRAPDIRLVPGKAGKTRLYEILRGGRFVLLTPAVARAAIGRRWTDRVDSATPADATLPIVLVRPDGYVAWATDETAPASRDEALRTALTRWCGQPTGV